MPVQLSHPQAVIRLQDITAELERLEGLETLTAEDEQSFDELTREFAEVDSHRRQLERTAALERIRGAAPSGGGRRPAVTAIQPGTSISGNSYDSDPILNPDSVEDRRFRNPWDLGEMRTFDRSPDQVGFEMRQRALSAVEKMSAATDTIRAAATSIIEQFDDKRGSIARMCLATSSPEYLRAWSKLAAGKGHMVSPEEQRALERAMSLTDNQGGYLVPFQLDPTVILASNGSKNDIRLRARSVVATGDVWHGVSAGAVQWRWADEASEAGDNAPPFDGPEVPVYKADGFVPISFEAMDDAENVTQEVGLLLAAGKDDLEAEAFVSGTGVKQPTGVVTALAGTASEIAPTTAETFASADLYALDGALPARHRRNAAWLANRHIYNLTRQFDTSGGSDMWVQLGEDLPPNLIGKPALEAEDMASGFDPAVAGNNRIMVFGDFQHYVIADRIGMSVEFIPHLMGANQRPKGQRGWYAWYRVGADSVLDSAFRMLNVATTA
ncbi:phage major capsid protein [Streptomyces hirsutus]|uniref:phage major capsid protein n=1 Tax=Streptomyces hirsutus TaxID=35620 RepID=UPI00368CF79B